MNSLVIPEKETRSLAQQYLQSPFSIRYAKLAAIIESDEGCELFGQCADKSDEA